MFVYKVLWIFTVKCLQLFNKELYVYFVQAPFCESLKTQLLFIILTRLEKPLEQEVLKLCATL